MSNAGPHFCRGTLPVAFVFSAPGEFESISKMPVSGMTGENLDCALAILHNKAPIIFASRHRYDYRITNSWQGILSSQRDDGRTEAKDREILSSSNISRVIAEVSGCELVVLCGKKPALLAESIYSLNIRIAVMSHLGNKSLNTKYKLEAACNCLAPHERRTKRAEQWALALIGLLALNGAA